jgi:7-cyano-7-deazaguanine synthase
MEYSTKSALILYSGGLDSTTLLVENLQRIEAALSFDYGSKHNEQELKHAAHLCALHSVRHQIIDLQFVGDHFRSDLLKSGGAVPDGHYAEENMKKTIVPFRNGIMLSIAAGFAESLGLNTILIANHYGDHAIYPDCRASFINPMSEAIHQGTGGAVNLEAPYTGLNKRDIALRGQALGIDYGLTWSCYKGQTVHCGTCGTCVERKEALYGFDPTIYAVQ